MTAPMYVISGGEALPVESQTNPFSPGDVVKLKSGGPNMVVCTLKRDEVTVRWFDRHGMNETSVAHHAIRKVERKNGSPQ